MTSRETAIAERLHEAASRIPVDRNEITVVRSARLSPVRAPRRRVIVGVAAAAAAVAVALVVTARSTPSSDNLEAGPAAMRPVHGPVAPHVTSPPDWFGEPEGAYRDPWERTGRWVSMAIGEVTGDTITQPIVISVFEGIYEPLDGAATVTTDGSGLRSVRIDGWEGWQALATSGTPTVMVAGSADEATLRAVLDAVEVVDPSGEFTLRLRDRPDGYAEVASSRALDRQANPGRTLASESGHASIDDVSDLSDPLLAAAFSGADLAAVDVGGSTGWVGVSSSPGGRLRFLTWSPRPGVVFEATTDDMDRTDGDLVDLALATSPLELDDWDALYDD
jgi:hypothetical protein